MFVIVKNPVYVKNSNLIDIINSGFQVSTMRVDFSEFSSLKEIKETLTYMNSVNVHLMNDREMVFRSDKMVEMIELLENTTSSNGFLDNRLLTRKANLRWAVLDLLEDGEEEENLPLSKNSGIV